jgi:uncharacterized membrane protein YeaQ/YmgE (transglycosylase-associated protein family)
MAGAGGAGACRRPANSKPEARRGTIALSGKHEGGDVGILSWLIFGLVAGVVARLIVPGKDPGGLIVTVAVGIAGAIIGGFIGTQLGFGTVTGFDFRSLVIAVIGSAVLLVLVRLFRK